MKKLSEADKLKYWIDIEFSILHVMFGIIMWQLTSGWLPHILFGAYILYSLIYTVPRLVHLAASDPDYLRVPKK